MQTLSLVFSIASLCISFFVSMTNGNKNMVKILILMFLCNFSMALSFLCLGLDGINGAVSNIVGSVACLINFIFTSKNKPIPLWLSIIYALVFTAINFRFGINAESIFALFPCLCFVMAIIQKSGKMFRVWQLLNCVFWCSYDIVIRSYQPLITHGILLICFIAGTIKNDVLQKENATQ